MLWDIQTNRFRLDKKSYFVKSHIDTLKLTSIDTGPLVFSFFQVSLI